MRHNVTRLAAVLALFTGAVAGATIACSSDDKAAAASDPSSCGPGPYVNLIGHVNELTASGVNRPKEGVVVTFDVCPDKPFTSDSDGKLVGKMTKGLTGAFKAEHPDTVPSYFGEWGTSADFEGNITVIPKIFQGIIAPDFTPNNTVLGLGVYYPAGTFDAGVPDGGPTEPCQRNEGVSFAVPDHPEAKVAYFTTDTIPKPDLAATATSTNGLSAVSGLAGGTMVTPTATKAGCKLSATANGFTGRIKVVTGYASVLQFEMTKQ